jgi:hypothetical protein
VEPVEEEDVKRRTLWIESVKEKYKSQSSNINDLALNTKKRGT